MRAEKRRQSISLFTLAGNMHIEKLKFSATLLMSMNDHEGITRVYLGLHVHFSK